MAKPEASSKRRSAAIERDRIEDQPGRVDSADNSLICIRASTELSQHRGSHAARKATKVTGFDPFNSCIHQKVDYLFSQKGEVFKHTRNAEASKGARLFIRESFFEPPDRSEIRSVANPHSGRINRSRRARQAQASSSARATTPP